MKTFLSFLIFVSSLAHAQTSSTEYELYQELNAAADFSKSSELKDVKKNVKNEYGLKCDKGNSVVTDAKFKIVVHESICSGEKTQKLKVAARYRGNSAGTISFSLVDTKLTNEN